MNIPNSETPARKRRGRPPGPPRVVVQLRQKANGRTATTWAVTVEVPFLRVMRAVQEALANLVCDHPPPATGRSTAVP